MTKGRVISVSTLYATIELLEPANLQPNQHVSLELAPERPPKQIEAQPKPILQASVTTANQGDLLQKGDSLLYERHESPGNSSLSIQEDSQNETVSSHNDTPSETDLVLGTWYDLSPKRDE